LRRNTVAIGPLVPTGDAVASAAGVSLLVAHEKMAEPLAYGITKALLEHTQELPAANETAKKIASTNAVRRSSIPLKAAKIGGMDRQTQRDWVIGFNDRGAGGLINIASPGVPPKLDAAHRASLARIVEEGPTPAIHGVVRWRACDLIMRPHEVFGLSVSDDIARSRTWVSPT
jgi:hypothetical protein